MRLVAISDTHNRHREMKLPEGDLLVHAGDVTTTGSLPEVEDFLAWFGAQPHRHKVWVAGNHDFLAEQIPDALETGGPLPCILPPGVTYLRDSLVEVEGLRVYGSPWQSDARKWAFWLPRDGDTIAERREAIPDGVDVLITHAPPLGIRDQGVATASYRDAHFGCPHLLAAVGRTKPRVHVFGHVHMGYGLTRLNGTDFVNAVNSPRKDLPLNAPIVLDL